MFATLLATKFFIPQTRPHLVSRPRLIDQLINGSVRKLSLVSAPPGFGKTSLICEWVYAYRSVRQKSSSPSQRVAWLSLDESDNDPVRFFAYFITALKRLEAEQTGFGDGALGMLQTPQPPPLETVLTALLNDLTTIPGKIILVLDDYHRIEANSIHTALAFLLEHMPPQLHLVIATRIDPPLPLARLRARDQLTEIRGAELRFSTAETAEFLNRVMGLALSEEAIDALETRTEGWIAGLQLAALSMQGTGDTAEFIKSFTGSHRYVLDYLLEEVLEQQSEPVQKFLLNTAILEKFTGPLCDRLTGQENSQATLEWLDHANLFILPLDEERHWFRYHHLFADLLKARLRQNQPDTLPSLHKRASEWFNEHDLHDEAIDHALLAEDYPRVAGLVEEIAQVEFIQGADSKLGHWLDALPAELVRARPHLCVYHAWHLLANGKPAEADRVLRDCHQNHKTTGDTSFAPELQGKLAATRAFSAFYHGDGPGIIEHATRALELLPKRASAWRGIAIHILGDAYSFEGKFGQGIQARLAAVEASQAAGNVFQLVIANLKLALDLRRTGKLSRVVEVCEGQKQLVERSGLSRTVLAGFLYGIWGETLAEMGELEQALRLAEQGVVLTSRGGDLAMQGWSYLCLVRVLFSSRDLPRAQEMISTLEDVARRSFVPPWIMAYAPIWRARIWLADGHLEAAVQWTDALGLDPAGRPVFQDEQAYLILARVLIAQGRFGEAETLLGNMAPAAEKDGRISTAIEMLTLRALAAGGRGDPTRALGWLAQALALAEPGGYLQIFVDEGPPLAGLLYEALAQGIAPDYVRRLLAAYPAAEPARPEPSTTQTGQTELFEPLSAREIEVLELIGTGLSNKEIAGRLYLSLNTVKGHTRNIYGKLGVNNRTQAFTRARALGILQSD